MMPGIYGVAQAITDLPDRIRRCTTGTPAPATGSELDGVYAVVSAATYILITGSLETNDNKLKIFLDTSPTSARTSSSRPTRRTSPAFIAMSASTEPTNNGPRGTPG